MGHGFGVVPKPLCAGPLEAGLEKMPMPAFNQPAANGQLRLDGRAVVEMAATIFQIADAGYHRIILRLRLGLGCEEGAEFAQKCIESARFERFLLVWRQSCGLSGQTTSAAAARYSLTL